MVLKTFNVDKNVYARFSSFCKSHGISMSKQVNMFMKAQIEQEPEAKRDYLEKLDKIRTGSFFQVNDFSREYGL